MAQLAIAWVLQNPNVSAAIVGASRPEQVKENVAASGVRLDDEILKRPSPVGAVGTGQLDLRLPDEMTRQHRCGSEHSAEETDDRVAPVVRKLATAVRRRRVLHEELAQAFEILRVEQPRVPIFKALDRFDLDEVFRRHAALPFSHLGLTV